MKLDQGRTLNYRGTPASLQMSILEAGIKEQDLIISILQPPPDEGTALTIGFKLSENSVNELRQALTRHHVRRRHIRLLTAYYEAEMHMRHGDPPQTEETPARMFMVPALRLSPVLTKAQTDD